MIYGLKIFHVLMMFLVYRICPHRSKSGVLSPDDMSGLLIDVTKHVSNLKYRVWEKMLDEIDYCECMESFFFFSSQVEIGELYKPISIFHQSVYMANFLSSSSCDIGPEHSTPLPHPVRQPDFPSLYKADQRLP